MDHLDWFYQRIAALRMQKGVSARDMSLSLGQSESYINKIENKRTLPLCSFSSTSATILGSRPMNFSIQI